MGTGKTMIAIILYLIARRLAFEMGIHLTPAIVVVPPTLVDQWIKEITKHTYLTQHAICRYKERARDLSEADDKYFIITSLNLVGSEMSNPAIERPKSKKVLYILHY
jgi:SNF2 family DNA or RNA helicase